MALTQLGASSSIVTFALIWTFLTNFCAGCLTVDEVPTDSSDIREMFPWVAAIFKKVGGMWVYHCGATITVATFTVITAASCVTKFGITDRDSTIPYHDKYSDIKILAGLLSTDYYTGGRDQHTQESDVGMIRDFQPPKSSVDGYQQTYLRSSNLAGIRLKTEFNQTKFVAPVCLVETPNSLAELLTLAPGERGLVAGFDQVPSSSTSQALKAFEFQITDPVTCARSYLSSSNSYFNAVCGKLVSATTANCSTISIDISPSFPCYMDGAGLIVSTDEEKTGVGRLYMMAVYTGNTMTITTRDSFYPYPVPQSNRTCNKRTKKKKNLAYFTKHGEHYRWAISHAFCSSDYLQCQSDSCRPLDDLCDGKIHCNDGTDETAVVCLNQFDCIQGQFRCKYGACIDELKVCDGNSDCADNSDEEVNATLCNEAVQNRKVTCAAIREEIGVKSISILPTYYYVSENDKALPAGTVLEQSCTEYYEVESSCGINEVIRTCSRNGNWEGNDGKFRCKPACGISETNQVEEVTDDDGKTISTHGEWPWHVSIYRNFTNGTTLICGGTLISIRVVLTAAHCLLQENGTILPTQAFHALVGNVVSKYSIAKKHRLTQEVTIKEFKIHGHYNPKNYEADIALIILTSSVNITLAVRPVCLTIDQELTAIQLQNANPVNGSNLAVAVGFGIIDKSKQALVSLRKIQLPIITKSECIKLLNATSHRFTWLCAGYINGTTAYPPHDPGSGLVVPFDWPGNERRYYVQGLASRSVSLRTNCRLCDKQALKIFTQVAPFTTWIQGIINMYL